jgi:hypothetical protein
MAKANIADHFADARALIDALPPGAEKRNCRCDFSKRRASKPAESARPQQSKEHPSEHD